MFFEISGVARGHDEIVGYRRCGNQAVFDMADAAFDLAFVLGLVRMAWHDARAVVSAEGFELVIDVGIEPVGAEFGVDALATQTRLKAACDDGFVISTQAFPRRCQRRFYIGFPKTRSVLFARLGGGDHVDGALWQRIASRI